MPARRRRNGGERSNGDRRPIDGVVTSHVLLLGAGAVFATPADASTAAAITPSGGPFLGLFGDGADATVDCAVVGSGCDGGNGGLIWGNGGNGLYGGIGGIGGAGGIGGRAGSPGVDG